MRATPLLALAVLLAAACEPRSSQMDAGNAFTAEPAVATKEPLPQPHPGWDVSGFDDLPWGTSQAQILQHRGAPFTTRSGPQGLNLMVYQNESLLSHSAQKIYMVSGTKGLAGGGFVIHAQANCDQVLRDLIALVEKRYPNLERTETRFPESCSPNTRVFWKDPSSGAMIAVVRDEFQGAVQITYLAPDGLDEEIQASRTREREEKARYEASKDATLDRL